ncbi:MAG: hypothetical protein HY451_00140 [Parcubacteria group bacterium]|nr:hypothetical protein [Parcubacteria group bacterium]
METYWLFISVVPLFLTAGMAWLVKASPAEYFAQEIIGMVFWAIIGLTAFLMLRAGGLSVLASSSIVFGASAAGFYFNSFIRLFLVWIFRA